jgi:hypothetical protein
MEVMKYNVEFKNNIEDRKCGNGHFGVHISPCRSERTGLFMGFILFSE